MNRFAELLDRLTYEPARNAKLRLMTDYFRSTPDPERGWALAALTGALTFAHAKPGLLRNLIAERTDPVLFELSYDYVGDLSETIALMWPKPDLSSPARGGGGEPTGPARSGRPDDRLREAAGGRVAAVDQATPPHHALPKPTLRVGVVSSEDGGQRPPMPPPPLRGGRKVEELSLTAVIETLATLGKAKLPAQLARWLDALDETGRWALIKLVTGGLRIGVSARLAKAAVAALGASDAEDIELLWPGLTSPYRDLFAWLEGRGEKPVSIDPAPFRS